MFKNKVVLITGGAGYIGDWAVEILLSHGHRVIILDNLMYGGKYMRMHQKLEFINGSILDIELINDLVQSVDTVIHLAAIVGDGACAANSIAAERVNVEGTRIIASACRTHNKRMIFASTCSVYGANNDLLDESSPTNPLSVYAQNKLDAESLVREVPNSVIFRLGTLFGLSGEHARLRCDLVANILTYRACMGQEITVYGGEQYRPILHVRDAGSMMAEAAVMRDYTGTFILSHKNYTICEIAQVIMGVCNLPQSQLKVTNISFEDARNYKVADTTNYLLRCSTGLEYGVREIAEVVRSGRVANVWDNVFHNAEYIRSQNGI